MDKGIHKVHGKGNLDTRHETGAHKLQHWKQTKEELSDITRSLRELQIHKPLDWENNDAFENQEHGTQWERGRIRRVWGRLGFFKHGDI